MGKCFGWIKPRRRMAAGNPASRVVRLLPVVEKLCLLNESGCRDILRLVSRRFPDIGLDIVHAQTVAGRDEPLGNLLTAARVAAILMGNVDPAYRELKLQKLGIPEQTLAQLLADSTDVWSFSLHHPLEVPFQQVRHLPTLQITGFPADCKPREARNLVCMLGGFRGYATFLPKGMLVIYTWWQTEGHAVYAMMRLRGMRMDPACSASLDVVQRSKWSVRKDPPPIYT